MLPHEQTAVFLTPKEKELIALRDGEGLTNAAVCRRLGIPRRSSSNASRAYRVAKAKLAEMGQAGQVVVKDPVSKEMRKAARTANTLEAQCEKALAAARETGIDDKTLSAQSAEISYMAMWRLAHDRRLWENATVRDLVSAAAMMVDKRQLLRGEPTQVIRIQDVRKLDEMAGLLHAEMERRGLLVDVTPERVADAPAKNANGGRRGGAYRALPG